MQGAVDPPRLEVAARRDHFGVDRVIPLALDLAEIRRSPGAHQRLESALLACAHDLDLQVPAAGRAAPVVCGAARCRRAGIGAGIGDHRQRPLDCRLRVADQHGIALLGDESAASEIIDERLVDRSALELEDIEVFGERVLPALQ